MSHLWYSAGSVTRPSLKPQICNAGGGNSSYGPGSISDGRGSNAASSRVPSKKQVLGQFTDAMLPPQYFINRAKGTIVAQLPNPGIMRKTDRSLSPALGPNLSKQKFSTYTNARTVPSRTATVAESPSSLYLSPHLAHNLRWWTGGVCRR